jgi:hypothetical protein
MMEDQFLPQCREGDLERVSNVPHFQIAVISARWIIDLYLHVFSQSAPFSPNNMFVFSSPVDVLYLAMI